MLGFIKSAGFEPMTSWP